MELLFDTFNLLILILKTIDFLSPVSMSDTFNDLKDAMENKILEMEGLVSDLIEQMDVIKEYVDMQKAIITKK